MRRRRWRWSWFRDSWGRTWRRDRFCCRWSWLCCWWSLFWSLWRCWWRFGSCFGLRWWYRVSLSCRFTLFGCCCRSARLWFCVSCSLRLSRSIRLLASYASPEFRGRLPDFRSTVGDAKRLQHVMASKLSGLLAFASVCRTVPRRFPCLAVGGHLTSLEILDLCIGIGLEVCVQCTLLGTFTIGIVLGGTTH